ncbi:Uncharacterised protein [Mycobacteroides abscessus subsp. abscessus]|nr:Uncharacterised protein [Mycobacteroides abscessus subsp. abscessus]
MATSRASARGSTSGRGPLAALNMSCPVSLRVRAAGLVRTSSRFCSTRSVNVRPVGIALLTMRERALVNASRVSAVTRKISAGTGATM